MRYQPVGLASWPLILVSSGAVNFKVMLQRILQRAACWERSRYLTVSNRSQAPRRAAIRCTPGYSAL